MKRWCCMTCEEEHRSRLPFPQNAMRQFVVCPDCGNKRCPRATRHDLPCSGSNAVGQKGSVYGGMAGHDDLVIPQLDHERQSTEPPVRSGQGEDRRRRVGTRHLWSDGDGGSPQLPRRLRSRDSRGEGVSRPWLRHDGSGSERLAYSGFQVIRNIRLWVLSHLLYP